MLIPSGEYEEGSLRFNCMRSFSGVVRLHMKPLELSVAPSLTGFGLYAPLIRLIFILFDAYVYFTL